MEFWWFCLGYEAYLSWIWVHGRDTPRSRKIIGTAAGIEMRLPMRKVQELVELALA